LSLRTYLVSREEPLAVEARRSPEDAPEVIDSARSSRVLGAVGVLAIGISVFTKCAIFGLIGVGGTRWVKQRDDRQKDLLRWLLEEIIDIGHKLGGWARDRLGPFSTGRCARMRAGSLVSPGLSSTRLVEGLFIWKHMMGPVDRGACARGGGGIPVLQYFCGDCSFCHQLPFDSAPR